jgi:hypothetical protein
MSMPALVADQPSPIPRRPVVTRAMMKAGLAAFDRHRGHLSDLYQCFESDKSDFVRAVFRAMRKAEG